VRTCWRAAPRARWTFGLRFGDEVTDYNPGYMILTGLLPVLMLAVLAVSRAYERRYCSSAPTSTSGCCGAGVGLIAGAALISYALDIDLARG